MRPTATASIGQPAAHTFRRAAHIVAVIAFALSGPAVTSAFAAAATVSVAAAANLVYALEALNTEFQRATPGASVSATFGASGTLFAQLTHGAPFDVFLSADTDYPQQVIASGLGDPTTLRTFATGRLVLWTTRDDLDIANTDAVLRANNVRKIAIAQPKTAPYGRAAQTMLERMNAWTAVRSKLVFGESIAQTAQFVESGNADIGFVALSLVLSPRLARRGHWREIPADQFPTVSLAHAAVLTKRGATNPAARAYLTFLESEAARTILRRFGYGVP